MHSRPLTPLALLCFATAVAPCGAQISFLPMPVTSSAPTPSSDVAILRDTSPTGELLAFVSLGATSETWAYANTAWTKLSLPVAPPPRTGFAATDGAIFGGRVGASTFLNDTWMTQIATNLWTPITSSNGNYPTPRADAAFCLGAGVNLLMGGRDQNGALGDCWELREIVTFPYGWNWIPAPTGPSARYDHAMTLHPLFGIPVLFGGRSANGSTLSDTWLYQNGAWSQANPAHTPPARSRHAMSYDLDRQVLVLFGGVDANQQPLGDVWEWNGSDWGQRPSALVPIARADASLSWDDSVRRCVIFGGAGQTDLWSYGSDYLPAMTSYGTTCHWTPFGQSELRGGAAGVPVLGRTLELWTTLLRPSSTAFLFLGVSDTSWGPFALPLSLDPYLPAAGCLLRTSVEVTLAAPAPAGLATFTLPVPNDLALAGATLYFQGLGELQAINPSYAWGTTNALRAKIGAY